MKEAGVEERSHAIANGDYLNGVPFITVIVDGGWSHRSYGHRYTSKSGVAVIIGAQTKKILFLGVRNKYCSICAIHECKEKIPDHLCYKNWNESSTAMEARHYFRRISKK